MRKPTEQQQQILNCQARIRLVAAAPGSGKTWLIGERIRMSLSSWKLAQRGIAALSFTNTAREEIIEAVGFRPGHPHFIGTLDSFIFRYLIRPFGHLCNAGLKRVRLVPAHFAAEMEEQQSWFQSTYKGKDGKIRNSGLLLTLSKQPRKAVHVFTSNFLDIQDGEPIFTGKEAFKTEPIRLSLDESRRVLKRKIDVWEKSGRVSHSDCAYVAFLLLTGPYGAAIRSMLARRFPVLIVDELQDTGYFLGHVLLALLQDRGFKAMLVGDPDQAIYEFSGAHPSLFNQFAALDGAVGYEMARSERCPNAICQVANCLASAGRMIDGNGRKGFAGIGWYEGPGHIEIQSFAKAIAGKGGELRILARKNSELLRIRGIHGEDSRTVIKGSRPLEKLRRAVHFLRTGSVNKALALTDSVLSRILLEADHVSDLELQQIGAEFAADWRALKLNLLMEACNQSACAISEWCSNMVVFLKQSLADLGWSRDKFPNLRMPKVPKKNLSGESLFADSLPVSDPSVSYLTVHGAKGQTHDTTLFFVTRPNRDSSCPSISWFDGESEERRIAFVAATRARGNFVLCLHKETLDRLKSTNANFVSSFTQVAPLMDLASNICGESVVQATPTSQP